MTRKILISRVFISENYAGWAQDPVRVEYNWHTHNEFAYIVAPTTPTATDKLLDVETLMVHAVMGDTLEELCRTS